MKPVARALADAAQHLSAISDTARLDAELLMAQAFGMERDQLLLDMPDRSVPDSFAAMVGRRARGEPVAYIVGRRAFWNIDIEVGPGVLIPRPDSEVLIASAIDHFVGTAGPDRILDLGTGPGTLLLAALDVWPGASGVGVDRSAAALKFARGNAGRLGLAERAQFHLGDWAEGLAERFDLVLCNPPYIAQGAELAPGVLEHEPHEALFAGEDGLDAYRRIVPRLGALLCGGGLAAIEIGFDQAEAVQALFRGNRLEPTLARDLAGRPRALLLTKV